MVNAGYATLEIKEKKIIKKVHHVVGKGWTVGMTKFFFKVDDNTKVILTNKPENHINLLEKLTEGGYIKNQEGFFNQEKNTVLVKDYKHKTEKKILSPR